MRGTTDNYSLPSLTFPGVYRGVVVDTDDPKERHRCRIRVAGVHSKNLSTTSDDDGSVPVDCLDWAEQASPIVGEGTSSGGMFSTPAKGAHVWVFFEGGNYRKPIYFAYSFGIPGETYSANKAFPTLADPTKINKYYDQPNSDGKSTYDNRKANVISGISTGDGSWNEPTPQKPAPYGDNIFLVSPSGVGIEMDTKVKSQRFVIQHPSGSFEEYHVAGDIVKKSAQNMYDLASCKRFIYSGGDSAETTKGSRRIYAAKDQRIQIDGIDTQKIKKSQTIEIGKNQTVKITKDQTIEVGKDQKVTVTSNQTISVGVKQVIDVLGIQNINVGGAQQMVVTGKQTWTVSGFADHKYKGGHQELNMGEKMVINNGSYTNYTNGFVTHTSTSLMRISAPLIFLG